MAGNADQAVVRNDWVVRILVATAMLQALVTGAGLWALGLFVAAAHADMLEDVLGIASALAEALLRIGLHVLGLA